MILDSVNLLPLIQMWLYGMLQVGRSCLEAILKPKIEVVSEFAKQVHFAAVVTFVAFRMLSPLGLQALLDRLHLLVGFDVRHVVILIGCGCLDPLRYHSIDSRATLHLTLGEQIGLEKILHKPLVSQSEVIDCRLEPGIVARR